MELGPEQGRAAPMLVEVLLELDVERLFGCGERCGQIRRRGHAPGTAPTGVSLIGSHSHDRRLLAIAAGLEDIIRIKA